MRCGLGQIAILATLAAVFAYQCHDLRLVLMFERSTRAFALAIVSIRSIVVRVTPRWRRSVKTGQAHTSRSVLDRSRRPRLKRAGGT